MKSWTGYPAQEARLFETVSQAAAMAVRSRRSVLDDRSACTWRLTCGASASVVTMAPQTGPRHAAILILWAAKPFQGVGLRQVTGGSN